MTHTTAPGRALVRFAPQRCATARWAVLFALAGTLWLAGCGSSGRSSPRDPTAPVSVTFAKSFGGAGDERAFGLDVDADGQITVAGIFVDELVGGTAERPWVIALDLNGNPRWQTSPLPSAGVTGVDHSFGQPALDDSAIYGGAITTPTGGTDIFLQRVDATGNALFTLVLDSGPWLGGTQFDPAAPAAADEPSGFYGNEFFGWFVVASSKAALVEPTSGGIVENARSIAVWFVEPDGTIRWQRRLAPSVVGGLDAATVSGPILAAATLTADARLAMAVKHRDAAHPELSVLWLDQGGSLTESADDFDAEYSAQSQSASTLYPTRLFATGDGGLLYTDSHSDTAIKLDPGGAESWRRNVYEGSAFDDLFHTLRFVAQTFPGGVGTPPRFWLGGSEFTNSASRGVVWALDAAGNVLERCDLGAYGSGAFGSGVVSLSGTDGGRNLRVLLSDPVRDVERFIGFSLRQIVVAPGCAVLADRTVDYPGNVDGYELGFLAPYWNVDGELIVTDNDQRRDRLTIRRFAANGDALPAFVPPEASSSSWDANSAQVAVLPDGRTRLAMRPPGVGNFRVLELDRFGSTVRSIEPDRRYFLEEPGHDGTGRMYVAASAFTEAICTPLFLTLENDGTVRENGFADDAPFSRLEAVATAPDGALEAVVGTCSGGEPLGLVRFDTGDNEPASIRYLPDAASVGYVYGLDISASATILLDSSGNRITHYDRAGASGWQVTLPSGFAGVPGSQLALTDAAASNDGGAVLLLKLSAFSLPDVLDDPAQSFGDDDVGLLKLDALGRPQWLRVFGAAGNERPHSLKRTPIGYAFLAVSNSLDAVTPGSQDLWVVHTGPDGHVSADAAGIDFCQACLGTVSGQALVDLLPLQRVDLADLSPAETLFYGSAPALVTELPASDSELLSLNTAQQCLGEASDIQEPPVGDPAPPAPGSFELAVTVITDGFPATPASPAGGRVTSLPAGIDCGDAGTDCRETFAADTQVELTAAPLAGFEFTQWVSGRVGDGCDATAGPVTTVQMDRSFECQASFQTVAAGPTQDLTLLFDGQPGRVVDVNTGQLDCTANCTVALPVAQSPIRLRAVEDTFTWQSWANCDAQPADPANPTGPPLCEIDITAPPPSIIVSFL